MIDINFLLVLLTQGPRPSYFQDWAFLNASWTSGVCLIFLLCVSDLISDIWLESTHLLHHWILMISLKFVSSNSVVVLGSESQYLIGYLRWCSPAYTVALTLKTRWWMIGMQDLCYWIITVMPFKNVLVWILHFVFIFLLFLLPHIFVLVCIFLCTQRHYSLVLPWVQFWFFLISVLFYLFKYLL